MLQIKNIVFSYLYSKNSVFVCNGIYTLYTIFFIQLVLTDLLMWYLDGFADNSR